MSESVRELIKQYQAFCEAAPYYIVVEDRSSDGAVTKQRIHAGFDVDVYGIKRGLELGPLSDYALAYTALQEVAQTVARDTGQSCSIEVIPFESTVIIDTKRRFQPEGTIRIRITHSRGLNEPVGPQEETALKTMLVHLHDLGFSLGK